MATSMAWDVFIAHAGQDKSAAETLYGLLKPHVRVFVDSECLELGDDWDEGLRRAQHQSMISVILVSSRTDDAYYEREEIAAAIALARTKTVKHRVIPVYLDANAMEQDSVPYGLRLKHGLVANEVGGLAGVAQELIEACQRLRQKLIDGDPAGDMLDEASFPAPTPQQFGAQVSGLPVRLGGRHPAASHSGSPADAAIRHPMRLSG